MARAPKAKVTLNVSIGRTREKVATPDARMSEMISRAILGDVGDHGSEYAMKGLVDRSQLANQLRRAIEKEYEKGVRFAINNMIGSISPGGIRNDVVMHTSQMKTFNSFGSAIDTEALGFRQFNKTNGKTEDLIKRPRGPLRWAALSRKTRQKKGHSRFFENTGALVKMLKSKAMSIVRKTGVVRVIVTEKQRRDARGRFMPHSKIMQLGSLELRLMPSVPRSMLPGLASGNFGMVDKNQAFEKMLINDELALKKLMGPERRPDIQRPLLQPIFTYWTNYYVPARIARALRGKR